MMNENNNNEVATYCRVAYKDEKRINQMNKDVQDYCKQKGYHIYKSYIDNGYSGNSIKRPGFNLMLEDLKKGKFNKIVTLDMARLTRDMCYFIKLDETAKKYNCGFEFVLEKFDTTTPRGKLFTNMMGVFCQMDKEMSKKRKSHKN